MPITPSKSPAKMAMISSEERVGSISEVNTNLIESQLKFELSCMTSEKIKDRLRPTIMKDAEKLKLATAALSKESENERKDALRKLVLEWCANSTLTAEQR